jgi:hypothetical protein
VASQGIQTEHSDNFFHHLGQDRKRREKGLPFKNLRLAERYVRGDAHLFVRFMVSLDLPDYCSCFQFRTEGEVIVPTRLVEGCAPSAGLCGDDQNKVMLVDSVKLMESPEKIIVSSVWTDTVDKVLGLWGDALCFSARFSFVDFHVLADRKVDSWVRYSNTSSKLGSQMIQGRPEIVSDIPYKQSDIRINGRDITQDELRRVRFSIELGNTDISIRHESDSLVAQVTDVIFGPFDLKEWTPQI